MNNPPSHFQSVCHSQEALLCAALLPHYVLTEVSPSLHAQGWNLSWAQVAPARTRLLLKRLGGGHQPTVQMSCNESDSIPPHHRETVISNSVSSGVSLIFCCCCCSWPHAHPCSGEERVDLPPLVAQQMVHGSHSQNKLSTTARSRRAWLFWFPV